MTREEEEGRLREEFRVIAEERMVRIFYLLEGAGMPVDLVTVTALQGVIERLIQELKREEIGQKKVLLADATGRVTGAVKVRGEDG